MDVEIFNRTERRLFKMKLDGQLPLICDEWSPEYEKIKLQVMHEVAEELAKEKQNG